MVKGKGSEFAEPCLKVDKQSKKKKSSLTTHVDVANTDTTVSKKHCNPDDYFHESSDDGDVAYASKKASAKSRKRANAPLGSSGTNKTKKRKTRSKNLHKPVKAVELRVCIVCIVCMRMTCSSS